MRKDIDRPPLQRSSCSLLRRRLELLELPTDPDVDENRKFFLGSEINTFFTLEILSELVNCACQHCSTFRAINRVGSRQSTSVLKHVTEGLQLRGRGKTYQLILAALLYIDHPALLHGFVRANCDDSRFEADINRLTPAEFQTKVWPQFYQHHPNDAAYVYGKLKRCIYKFFVPSLEDNGFSVYDSKVIMPFLNERKVGYKSEDGEFRFDGAYGRIYSFEIPEEYRNFTTAQGITRFVRKELRDDNHSAIFQAEQANINYVRRIHDEHIVKVIKVYKHGDTGNIIFPEARTNLRHYLRNARFGASDVWHGPLQAHPFWKQLLGLARALNKILNYEAEDESRHNILFGYHFDLKPANILVEHDGRFLISDFGQAHFKKIGATSSNVVGFGGTESYAPPEIDSLEERQNRQYDIWSLGCIFLEIVTFIVQGYTGVHELDRRRLQTLTHLSRRDDRFFVRQGDQCHLKKAVVEWMNTLPASCPTNSSASLVTNVLALIRRMLTVSVQDRCTSRELSCVLSDILNSTQDPVENVNSSLCVDQSPSEGREIGALAISRLRKLKYYSKYWNSGHIRFMLSDDILQLHAYEARRWEKIADLGEIRFLKLMPRYATTDVGQHRYSDASIFLHSTSTPLTRLQTSNKFWSALLDDALHLQEALLGQRIIRHVPGVRACLTFAAPLISVLESPSKLKRSGTVLEVHPTVQLWHEKPRGLCRESKIKFDVSTRPNYPASFIRRLVLIDMQYICIIRIDHHVQLEAAGDSDHPFRMCLVPSKGPSRQNFPCLLLRKEVNEELAGIPLCIRSMKFDEERKSSKLVSAYLHFECERSMNEFREAYRTLKYNWELEQKQFAKMQNLMGPLFGYARNAA